MVDTVYGGVNHQEQSQSGKYVTFNEAVDTLDAMSGMGVRGNRLINSGLTSWQAGTSFAAIANDAWFADLFQHNKLISTGVATISRSTDTPGLDAPFSAYVDVTTADAAVAAGDLITIKQKIEGYMARDALLGVAGARQMHLTFSVKASKTGVYCVSFLNSAENRSYVAEYSILVADTWETKTIALTGDLTGTWLTGGAAIGLSVYWALMAGATYQTTADTWAAGKFHATANQVNFFDNVVNDWRMANPRLYVGSIPSNATGVPVGDREHALELARIKRYYERIVGNSVAGYGYGAGQCISATDARIPVHYTEKCKVPAVTVSAAADFDVLNAAGGVVACTVLAAANVHPKGSIMQATVAAGLVAGNATLLKDDGTALSTIDIDARL